MTALAPAQHATDLVRQRDKAFARAQKHSRRVNLLKIALPLAAVLIGGGFAIYSYVITPAAVSINVAESAISNGRLVMASPKLEGFTQDNRPYSMSATRAFQDLQNMSLIELEEISARLPFDNDTIAVLTAPGGLYDRDRNTLDFQGDLEIKTDDGMSAKLNSAFVDISTGSVQTNKPVDIKMKGTSVQADSLRVEQNGKILVFDKRVRMVLDPKRGQSQE